MAAVVGFSSSFVVVLAGLTAVGASAAQAASGLLAVCVTQALGMLWLSLRHRTPLTLAWSTPGAALLVSTGTVAGGWPAAVGAFVVTGLLILATGLIPRLGDLIASIPPALARAMLAGVLLPLCLAPVTAVVDEPALVGPVVVTWLVMQALGRQWGRRWAVPAALLVALVVVVIEAGSSVPAGDLVPSLTWTTPEWTVSAVVSIALPLYIVTMASQNVPGVAVMASHGYDVPWRETMNITGLGTVVSAPFGGHAVNLAAITAALAAGPTAGPDRSRRWLASATAAWCYLALAIGCSALGALVAAAPDGVIQAAAGLALLGTLASSLSEALADPAERESAVVTFVVAASGITVLGVGAAFWALVAGLVVRAVIRGSSVADPTRPVDDASPTRP